MDGTVEGDKKQALPNSELSYTTITYFTLTELNLQNSCSRKQFYIISKLLN